MKSHTHKVRIGQDQFTESQWEKVSQEYEVDTKGKKPCLLVPVEVPQLEHEDMTRSLGDVAEEIRADWPDFDSLSLVDEINGKIRISANPIARTKSGCGLEMTVARAKQIVVKAAESGEIDAADAFKILAGSNDGLKKAAEKLEG